MRFAEAPVNDSNWKQLGADSPKLRSWRAHYLGYFATLYKRPHSLVLTLTSRSSAVEDVLVHW